jgi:predicted nucleotidyltransferase
MCASLAALLVVRIRVPMMSICSLNLDPQARPLDLLELGCDLEDVLGVKVDIGTPALLRTFLRDQVLAEAAAL